VITMATGVMVIAMATGAVMTDLVLARLPG